VISRSERISGPACGGSQAAPERPRRAIAGDFGGRGAQPPPDGGHGARAREVAGTLTTQRFPAPFWWHLLQLPLDSNEPPPG
jgi:hypothetical protein